MVVKAESGSITMVKKTKFKKPAEFSKQKMKRVFLEALERYNRITRDLPESFKLRRNFESEDDSEEELKTSRKNSKKPYPKLGTAPRAKTIKELQSRLNDVKGKSGYATKLIKKGLKNRLKKKEKLEERRENKRLKMTKSKGNQVKPNMDNNDMETPSTSKEEGRVMFNKFDFPDPEKETKTPKDAKAILSRIQKSEQKLKSLSERGHEDKVIRIKTQQAWDKAIQQADGVKVKDDVDLLKKTIAKKKQQKSKSAQKWDARLETTQKKKEEAQKKRKENIAGKKKEKKQKKIKKSIKKGRVVL